MSTHNIYFRKKKKEIPDTLSYLDLRILLHLCLVSMGPNSGRYVL